MKAQNSCKKNQEQVAEILIGKLFNFIAQNEEKGKNEQRRKTTWRYVW